MGWDNPLVHGPLVDIWIQMVAELEPAVLSLHTWVGVIIQAGPALSVPSDQLVCFWEVQSDHLVSLEKRVLWGDQFYLVIYFFIIYFFEAGSLPIPGCLRTNYV